jgi:hypothetical protein
VDALVVAPEWRAKFRSGIGVVESVARVEGVGELVGISRPGKLDLDGELVIVRADEVDATVLLVDAQTPDVVVAILGDRTHELACIIEYPVSVGAG